MEFLPIVVSAIAAALVVPLFQWFKKASVWIDTRSAVLKQAMVIGLSFLFAMVTKLTGVPLPDSLGGFDTTTLQTALTAILAFGLHKVKKSRTPA